MEFVLGDQTYRITSTGTVLPLRDGADPDLMPWKSFSPDQKNNVYFGVQSSDDEEAVGLGLWTAHVCLSVGKALEPADITAIYRK